MRLKLLATPWIGFSSLLLVLLSVPSASVVQAVDLPFTVIQGDRNQYHKLATPTPPMAV